MGMAFELLVFCGIFALAIGLLGCFVGTTADDRRRQRAEHERRQHAPAPWDPGATNGRRNRQR